MPVQKQLQVVRVCSGEPLSTTEIARRLGRGNGGDTKALAERAAIGGGLSRVTHPNRSDAVLYQASPQGIEKLIAEGIEVQPGVYLVLIQEPLTPAAASAMAAFVRDDPPIWMLRIHGRYRLAIAYPDSTVADALERDVVTAAGAAEAAAVVRVDRQEFPLNLRR